MANVLTAAFVGGEIDPKLIGRADLDFYGYACEACRNFIVQPLGGASRRPGSKLIAIGKTAADTVLLIPFQFSTTQAYMIEVGDEYFRFYRDQGQIESGGGAYEISSPYALEDLFGDDGEPMLRTLQSADTMYLFHPDYALRQLTRTGHTSWTLALFDLRGPWLDANDASTTLTPSATTGSITITANTTARINDGDGFGAGDIGRLVTINHSSTWGVARITAITSSTVVSATVLEEFGATTGVAVWRLGVYSDGNGYPPAGTFHAGRLWLAGPAAYPQRLDASQSGDFPNFDQGTGLDNESFARTLDSDQVNAIRWLVTARDLLTGTFGAEWLVSASATNAVITPDNAKAQRQSTEGSAAISPVSVDNAVIFVHRLKKTLHELAYVFESDAYRAPELTLRARHLTLPRIASIVYQQQPFRVIWTVLKDGGLAGLTYLRGQSVLAWHSHRLGGSGKVKSAAVISGDGYDELWLSVERTIDGATQNTIEVIQAPLEDNEPQEQAFYLDCGLTYDGSQSETLTPGAGATVTGTTEVTFTAGGSVFSAGDVGRYIDYRIAAQPDAIPPVEEVSARAEITAYTSGTEVDCTILSAFPSTDAIAASAWRLTATTIAGLGHLEGETVKVLVDGGVHPERTVESGEIELAYAGGLVHVGLAYEHVLRPTKVQNGDGRGAATGRRQRYEAVSLLLHRSGGSTVGRPGKTGDPISFKTLTQFDAAIPLRSETVATPFNGEWADGASMEVRGDDPLPFTVLGIAIKEETTGR